MNYSNEPGHCRVDIFTESGKWYTTEVIDMTNYYNEPLIQNAVKKACGKAFGGQYIGMTAVCLEPYHKYKHPTSFVIKD